MAHDGSLASLVEEWIVGKIAALAQFAAADVEVFTGSDAPGGQKLIEEFANHRSPYAAVAFESDVAVPLQEGAQNYRPTYGVYIVVQNKRGDGNARSGDPETPGTNLLRDLLRNALHDKEPNLSANGRFAERAEWNGVNIVFQRKGLFILRCEVVVLETAAA